jgi:hypothetical protein
MTALILCNTSESPDLPVRLRVTRCGWGLDPGKGALAKGAISVPSGRRDRTALSAAAIEAIEPAARGGAVRVSFISSCEMAMLEARTRLMVPCTVARLMQETGLRGVEYADEPGARPRETTAPSARGTLCAGTYR